MSDRSKRVGLLILGLVVTAIFVNLGNWQLERAEGKRAALARFEDHARSPAFDLEGIEKSKILDKVGQSAFANGGYRLDTVTILDNQLLGGRTGYLVYTAYRIGQTDRHVLVNRGWVEANPDRYQLPEIAANPLSPHVTGRLSAPPSEGIRLAGADMIESMGQGIWRVQKIDFDALARPSDSICYQYLYCSTTGCRAVLFETGGPQASARTDISDMRSNGLPWH